MVSEYSYEEVIDIIQNKRRFGNLTGCEISKIMLEKIGHPEEGLPVIHIAGTNGKGSVSAFLTEILDTAGLKVGMFTSPHLVDFRERIRINGELIGKEDTHRLGKMLLEQDFGVSPTMFDYCLAMALLYFKEQQCDVIVLETGLGGRYDSTNAVAIPEVSVITKIGYDHMAILGETLIEIAGEKAGIIKHGTKLICESQDAEIEAIFNQTAKEVGADSIQIIKMSEIQRCDDNCFSAYGYENLTMQMLGLHQYENATAALLAARAFLETRMQEHEIEQAIRKGIANAKWMGRMEVLMEQPFFMVDGAHNAHGVTALRKSLEALYPGEKFHFIMGVMADKDYVDMIAQLMPLAIDFATVTVGSDRSLEAEELASCIRKMGIPATCKESLEAAMSEITQARVKKTVAFGSLYFIGEIESMII